MARRMQEIQGEENKPMNVDQKKRPQGSDSPDLGSQADAEQEEEKPGKGKKEQNGENPRSPQPPKAPPSPRR
jgi:hypothetical protein